MTKDEWADLAAAALAACVQAMRTVAPSLPEGDRRKLLDSAADYAEGIADQRPIKAPTK